MADPIQLEGSKVKKLNVNYFNIKYHKRKYIDFSWHLIKRYNCLFYQNDI